MFKRGREELHSAPATEKRVDRKERAMKTNLKTLTAAIVLSTALAAPAFAATNHHRAYGMKEFRGSYNQVITPSSQGAVNQENFGFSGRDPSRVGGFDPSLNPSGS
jgi:hypothetical protein